MRHEVADGQRHALPPQDSPESVPIPVLPTWPSAGWRRNRLPRSSPLFSSPGSDMNPIHNVGGNSPIQKITNTPIQKQTPADGAGRLPIKDRVELSGVGHLLGALRSNDIRADKVAG